LLAGISMPASSSSMSLYKPPLLIIAALLVMAGYLWPVAWAGRQMLLHVVAMTLVAPVVMYTLCRFQGLARDDPAPRKLWAATALQALLFLVWHTPYGMSTAMHKSGGELLLQGSLLVAACMFWWTLLRLHRDQTGHAILALLFTGKLFCLVALLLTFAPRALYHAMPLEHQQLAGLIMITICPLCYVASAIWLCWRWLRRIEQNTLPLEGGLCG
jgi:putative membrane protein